MARENATDKYLRLFFEEKEIPYACWDFEDNAGTMHIIDSERVVELLKLAPQREKTQAANMLRRLDFVNAPIAPFLKHLAECFVNTQTQGEVA